MSPISPVATEEYLLVTILVMEFWQDARDTEVEADLAHDWICAEQMKFCKLKQIK